MGAGALGLAAHVLLRLLEHAQVREHGEGEVVVAALLEALGRLGELGLVGEQVAQEDVRFGSAAVALLLFSIANVFIENFFIEIFIQIFLFGNFTQIFL